MIVGRGDYSWFLAWFDLKFPVCEGLGFLGFISNSLFAWVFAWFDLQFPVCRGLYLVRSPIPCL